MNANRSPNKPANGATLLGNTKNTGNEVKPFQDIPSFMPAPVNQTLQTVNTVANNVKNRMVNTASNAVNHMGKVMSKILPKDLSDSVQDSFRNSINATGTDLSPWLSMTLIVTLGVLLIVLILVIGFGEQIRFASLVAWKRIQSWFSPPPPPLPPTNDLPKDVEKMIPVKKEVFNIAQNKYKYDDAEPLCKAFGAELATYDQVKEAYKKGADWCNYGWIKGQAAVYPTQQSTYDKLQQGPEDQHMACGVPGVNGGYFDNPDLRFGVNCYGVKPSENDADIKHIMGQDGAMTQETIVFNKKVQDFKKHKSEIAVNPFKEGNWSQ